MASNLRSFPGEQGSRFVHHASTVKESGEYGVIFTMGGGIGLKVIIRIPHRDRRSTGRIL
ncbi:MAG: hypothetical protein ABIJ57_16795 [Pseudomonadota bacterium]